MDLQLEQLIRRRHCAKGDGAEHKCVGTCTITGDGLKLSCPLCGDGEERQAAHFPAGQVALAKSILSSAGVSWEFLSGETQVAVLKEMNRRSCPYCGEPCHEQRDKFYQCACGATRKGYPQTWEAPR